MPKGTKRNRNLLNERNTSAIARPPVSKNLYQPDPPAADPGVRTMLKQLPVKGSRRLAEALKDKKGLGGLLGHVPKFQNSGTGMMDGRQIPVVLVLVRDKTGATRAGIELHLRDKTTGALLDLSRTNDVGAMLLRFPMPMPMQMRDKPTEGIVELADGSKKLNVTVPPMPKQHVLELLTLDELPAVPPGSAPAIGDNPLGRLPRDFTTDLCDAVSSVLPTVPDPIFAGVAAAGDFRAERSLAYKRLALPRVVDSPTAGGTPLPPNRRFMVRVLQEWKFLGYTLGELASAEPLDPGSLLRETLASAEQLAQQVSKTVEGSTSNLSETLQSTLTQLSSIDTLVQVATHVDSGVAAGVKAPGAGIGAIIGGVLGGIGGAIVGGIFGGLAGGVGANVGTNVNTSASTDTNVHTSLDVNSRIHFARSIVNQAVRSLTSALRQTQSAVSREIGRVSPLLSRVTNLLHWTLYENYMVCSYVEDVFEIVTEQFLELPLPVTSDIPVYFLDEEIVDYRRYFEPVLLEPRLASHFSVLANAVAQRLAGGQPVTRIHFVVDFATSTMSADLKLRVGEDELVLHLNNGQTRAQGTMYSSPVMPAQPWPVRLHAECDSRHYTLLFWHADIAGVGHSFAYPDVVRRIGAGAGRSDY
jgi:hypothetical protein